MTHERVGRFPRPYGQAGEWARGKTTTPHVGRAPQWALAAGTRPHGPPKDARSQSPTMGAATVEPASARVRSSAKVCGRPGARHPGGPLSLRHQQMECAGAPPASLHHMNWRRCVWRPAQPSWTETGRPRGSRCAPSATRAPIPPASASLTRPNHLHPMKDGYGLLPRSGRRRWPPLSPRSCLWVFPSPGPGGSCTNSSGDARYPCGQGLPGSRPV